MNKGKEYFGTGSPIVNYTDVYHHRSLNAEDLKGRVQVTTKELQNNSAKKGDLFFTRTSETIEEIGFPAVLLSARNDTVFSGFLIRTRAIDRDPLRYLFKKYIFYTDTFRKEMMRKSTITTRALTSGKNLSQMNMAFPNDAKEQDKIGTLISKLDNLIDLQQKKLEQLRLLKKAMLQQIFTDTAQPQSRFNGFNDNWEQRKLGKVVNITMGQSPSSKNYTENPSDHILVQGNADMKNGRVVPRVWTTQITKQADKGDLILSVRAPVGDIGRTDYDIVIGRGVAAIKGNEYVFQLLTKLKDSGYWKRFSTGSTFDSINSNNIKNAKVMMPSESEQAKIGDFLRHLDSLTALHQRKLNNFKQAKKFLLQKLFI